MFRSLYGRLMLLFFAALLAAMSLLSVLLYQRIRTDKIEARLDALAAQARDVAFLAAQRTGTSDATTDAYLFWKSQEISYEYDAYIIILDRAGNLIPIGDQTMEFSYDFTFDALYEMLSRITQGAELRMRTELDTGNPVFTVGVPYMQDGRVLGAVFIHTSEQSVEASYKEILVQCFMAMLIALAIGAAIILITTRVITRPLREMASAADRFALGDFETRVEVRSRDEVGRLAEAFNHMARDLDRLEQTRREFVANVSHELRSPLTSMQGFINGILDGTVPEEEREHYLGIVLEETRRLNKLISTLLDLSHIESGHTEVAKTRFDVGEMICRVLVRQEDRIDEKRMQVNLDLPETPCYVSADADRIEQVLVNLIDNAVKYGREEGELTLSAKRANGHVTVTIGEEGEGIPPEDLPYVFERFYKVDKAHTTGEGTGLGLAIVKSIIDQHGQTITVASEPGKDTVFTFTLEGA